MVIVIHLVSSMYHVGATPFTAPLKQIQERNAEQLSLDTLDLEALYSA